jgi:hypothetical protein
LSELTVSYELSLSPSGLTLSTASLKGERKLPGEKLPALTPVPDGADFEQSSLACQGKLLPANHPVVVLVNCELRSRQGAKQIGAIRTTIRESFRSLRKFVAAFPVSSAVSLSPL